ncbi:MAG: ParB N-terminal domain-containing protein [Ruminococcus sp.]|nr:ParB N-terminal domain-containing protein [Ruminococcus sp.]
MSAGSGETETESKRRPPLKVVSLNISDLIPSSDNFYSVENIKELKTSIEMFGVLQNLTVKPLENGKYEIISGHRRHKACMELVAEGKTEFEYIPCGIQAEQDEIKERILLIMTNSTARELSDWEKMKQAEELRKNFEELKKRENLTGRVRDLVAEALNTSPTQIARLNAIDNNLNPEFKEEFKQGKIGTSAAYELSGMSKEQQQQAYSEYQESGSVSASEVKEQKKQAEATAPAESKDFAEYDRALNNVKEIVEATPPPKAYEPPIIEDYPETPSDFEEGEETERAPTEYRDFADLSETEKAAAAVEFLNEKRFALFAPGEDTRIFDFILETLELYQETAWK